MRTGGERSFARRGLGRYLLPLALALSFQGGFAVAVMVLDRANRSLPSNASYVVAVEAAFAFSFLAVWGVRAYRVRRRIARALVSPLDAELPGAGPGPEAAWKALTEAARAEAIAAIARRDAEARVELDAFLASVHALKTPATALSLMAQRSTADGSPLSADEARLEIDELGRILDRTLGRLRLGDFESGSRITRLDAAAAVREGVKRQRRLLIARKIRVEVGVEGGLAVETDASWLAFILDQLISNAAKYAASRINVDIAAEGRRVRIEIADDGPGLDEEDRLRAFGKSASGSAGAMSRSEACPASSGYGLYLASEAAKRLGLDIELDPGIEEGTVARLLLPRALDPLDDLADA
jgi:signal transduction histidine kinase